MATVIRLSCILLLFLGVSGVVDECPPWFTLEQSNSFTFSQCVCSDAVDFAITCKQREHTSYLKPGCCAFQDVEINQTVVGSCSYVFPVRMCFPLTSNTMGSFNYQRSSVSSTTSFVGISREKYEHLSVAGVQMALGHPSTPSGASV